MPKQILVKLSDVGMVSVEFADDAHFTKRELMRVLKTIQHEARQSVKRYRREQRLKESEKELNNERQTEQFKFQRSSDEGGHKSGSVIAEAADRGTAEPNSGLASFVTAKAKRRSDEAPRRGPEAA